MIKKNGLVKRGAGQQQRPRKSTYQQARRRQRLSGPGFYRADD
jgi:hypothetical protein